MQYNVPQFIEIEDHIVGPLTAKQLGWLAMGAVILLILWSVLDLSAFIIAAIFVAAIFSSLAFFRPNGQPLIKFILSSIYFILHPKVYVWRKVPGKMKPLKKASQKNIKAAPKKILTREKVRELSEILDKE